jgi:arylsulfatase A-like enzyme
MPHPPALLACWLTLAIGLITAAGSGAAAGAGATDARPNVLVIQIDDLNDWVEPLGGHPQVQTPNMNALAQRGVNFTSAHCQAAVCNPSRTSYMTGLRPSTTGVYALGPWFRTVEGFENWTTLPQHFQKHGYKTLTTGKVYHGAYPPRSGRKDGVEFSEWGYHGSHHPRPDEPFVEASPHPLVDWGVFPERDEQQSDWKVANWAIEHIKDRPADKPFFMTVGFRKPHVPLYATQPWWDLYPKDTVKMPKLRADDRADTPRFSWYLHWKLPEPRLAWLKERDEWQNKVRGYLACVSFVDHLVGRLMNTLKEEGLWDNTIVVLLSDHGYHLGSKAITGKNTLWHETTRVPFIFAGPGIAQNQRCDEAVELLDLYPTLAALCDLPERDGLDGQSLTELLQNPEADRARPAVCTHGPNNHAVITERWRYIQYANGSEELYDLKADPHEWDNLANAPGMTSVKQRLAQHLPENDAEPVDGRGHRVRLLEMVDGTAHWQGKPIEADDPIPMEPGG